MNDSIDEQAGHSFKEFLNSLAETKEWCHETSNSFSALLRTPHLQPEPLNGSRKKVIGSVIRNRVIALREYRDRIKKWKEAGMTVPLVQHKGRLLVYEPDGNLADGAAKISSFGFLMMTIFRLGILGSHMLLRIIIMAI